jgi:hypothetical protein
MLTDSGHQAHVGNNVKFSFELSWLFQDGFFDMVWRPNGQKSHLETHLLKLGKK